MIALTLGERPSRSTTLSLLWGVRTFPPPPQFYRYRMWGWVTRDKKRTQSGWRWMQTSSWSEIKDFQKSPWKTLFFGAGILCSPLPRLVRGKKKPDWGPYSRKLNRLRARNLPIRNKNLLSGPLRFFKKNPYVILAMTACINIVHLARNGSRIIIFQSKHIKFWSLKVATQNNNIPLVKWKVNEQTISFFGAIRCEEISRRIWSFNCN